MDKAASPDRLIPYDQMKQQIESSVTDALFSASEETQLSIEFVQEKTRVGFSLPPLTESMLFDALVILKRHIENIRIVSFESGHYSFQALNSNLFNTQSITDNFKIDFFSIVGSRAEAAKKGNLTQEEINAVIEIIKAMNQQLAFKPEQRLEELGASVIAGESAPGWDYIAGYGDTKRKIRESVILPVKNPVIYDSIASLTRRVYESNRPKAVLFEGPPGVGKTTAARIIAGDSSMPLVYVPVESIMSKWYGQSSRNLAEIFDLCEEMGGAVIFLDEIDSLAGSRDQNMFEATRRILSVLLRKLDGIDSAEKTITIGATNRISDLDPALLSRFDQIIRFPYPDETERASIFQGYARHLTAEECSHLGLRTQDCTGRNIKDICELTERRWARKIILKEMEVSPPPFDYYRQSVQLWKNSLRD